jgi:hypothetical protein
VRCSELTIGHINLSKPQVQKQVQRNITKEKLDFIQKWAKYDSLELNVETILTQVMERTEYKFFWNPRGVDITWTTKLGDCTDFAMVKKELLTMMNVKSRLVHGIATGGKHDWLEYNLNGTWITDNNGDEIIYKKGNGIW